MIMSMSEYELSMVLEAKKGKKKALDRLYDALHKTLCGVIEQEIGDRSRAETILRAVFEKLKIRVKTVTDPAQFEIMAIEETVNECKKYPKSDKPASESGATQFQTYESQKKPEQPEAQPKESFVHREESARSNAPVGVSAQNPFRQAPQQYTPPVQQPIQRPVQQPVQRPVQRPIQRPVQQPVQRPVQQPAQRPIQRPVQQPAQRPVQQPAPQFAQQYPKRPVQQPAQRPVQQPAQRPAPQQSQRPAPQFAQQYPNRPAPQQSQRPAPQFAQQYPQRPAPQQQPQRPAPQYGQRPVQQPSQQPPQRPGAQPKNNTNNR